MKRPIWPIVAATVALVLLGVLVASAFPDALERVAEELGFASRAGTLWSGSPFADYETRGVGWKWAAQASAGLVGIVLIYGFGLLFGKAIKGGKRQRR